MIRWFKSLFAWRVIRDTGVWRYYENTVTRQRKAVWRGGGYQPLASDLLDIGDVVYGPNGREIIRGDFETLPRC